MLNGVWKIWISEVLGLGSATLESIDRKIVVTPTPTRRTWFEIFAMSNKKRTGSIKRKKLWFFGRCAARSSGRPVRILVNNKVIVTDKIDRGCGDVF